MSRYDGKRREFADQPWRFFQEYPENEEEAFRESGRPRFVGMPSEDQFEPFPYRGNIVWVDDGKVAFQADPEGSVHLSTVDPDPNGFYVVGADPAQGIGKDFSSAHVLTFDDDGFPEIVGYYHSNQVHPTEYAADLDALGRFFQGREWGAKIAVENQGGQGELVINELHKHLEYPNPYMHQVAGTRKSKAVRLFAFPMTVDRRKAIIDRLAKYLVPSNGILPLRGVHPALRVELGQFVAQETANGNLRYAADVGCHDDLVMSLAIGLWVLVEEYTDASPDAAPVEDFVWSQPTTLNLTTLREERLRVEQEIEEQQRWMRESLILGSELLHIPRGRR